MHADLLTQETAVIPGPKPNDPLNLAPVRHVLPFQISVPMPVSAMQNDVLVQDTVFSPPPGGESSRHFVPFHRSANEDELDCTAVK